MEVEIIIQTKRITKEYCFVLSSILQYYSLLRQQKLEIQSIFVQQSEKFKMHRKF